MADSIQIKSEWSDEKSLELVRKFNRFAKKRSLSSVSDVISRLSSLMDESSGKRRKDCAEILYAIAEKNPMLVNPRDQTRIANFLLTGEFPAPLTEEEVESLFASSNSTPTNTSEFFVNPTYPSAQSSGSYDVWSEEDFKDSTPVNPLEKSVKDLKIININRIKKKLQQTLSDRKCALGDGKFEDYEGTIYECTCGTLYHEVCLKTQAIFVGKCHICDRTFQ